MCYFYYLKDAFLYGQSIPNLQIFIDNIQKDVQSIISQYCFGNRVDLKYH